MKKLESVLLIENDPITRFLTQRILTREGIEQVYEARNGQEGIEFVEKQSPDLILLDISMPVMDGFQFLNAIQSRQLISDTKIAMLTSSNRQEDQDKVSQYKAVIAYIEKPFDKISFQKIIAFFKI